MHICVLGATGLVGQELSHLLPLYWPEAEYSLYASRPREVSFAGANRPVREASALLEAKSVKDGLALVALDDEHSARYVPVLLEQGYRVVDKSNTYRQDPSVPLVAAGVNDELVTAQTSLVANPNCTTIPLTIALRPIMDRYGLRSVTASTYQAISGAGQGTLETFAADTARNVEAEDLLGLSFPAGNYAGNVVPHNGKTDASGFSAEEQKLMSESRKILAAPSLHVSAQCCRVPVAVGHYINVWMELDKDASVAELEELLQSAPALARHIRLFPGAAGDGLSSLATAGHRDEVLVGRIRADVSPGAGQSGSVSSSRRFCMTVVADNLRLGAATNAVRVATRWFPTMFAG